VEERAVDPQGVLALDAEVDPVVNHLGASEHLRDQMADLSEGVRHLGVRPQRFAGQPLDHPPFDTRIASSRRSTSGR
jgi:hypothetical protein